MQLSEPLFSTCESLCEKVLSKILPKSVHAFLNNLEFFVLGLRQIPQILSYRKHEEKEKVK